MNLWKQIQNLKSKEDKEYERKIKAASDSTILSINKLNAICGVKEASNGNG